MYVHEVPNHNVRGRVGSYTVLAHRILHMYICIEPIEAKTPLSFQPIGKEDLAAFKFGFGDLPCC